MKCRGILEKIFLFPNHAISHNARVQRENERYDFSGNIESSGLISQHRQQSQHPCNHPENEHKQKSYSNGDTKDAIPNDEFRARGT